MNKNENLLFDLEPQFLVEGRRVPYQGLVIELELEVAPA
jgi:hypothetical protein